MKVHINDEECVGDGSCAELCPEIFKMEGDLAVVKKEQVPEELEDLVREAAETCPVDAIEIDE
jgi:ferredoxin